MSSPSGFDLTTIDAASVAASAAVLPATAAVLPATAAVARKSGADQGVARSTSGLRQGHLQDSHLNNHLLLFAHQRKPNGNRHNNDDDEGGRRNDLPVRACEASFVLERVYLLGWVEAYIILPSGVYGVARVDSISPPHMIHLLLTIRAPPHHIVGVIGESAPKVGRAVRELAGADYQAALEAERLRMGERIVAAVIIIGKTTFLILDIRAEEARVAA